MKGEIKLNWSKLKKKRKKQVEKEIKAETEMCNKEPAETREQYLTRKVQQIKDDTFVSAEVIKQYFQLNASPFLQFNALICVISNIIIMLEINCKGVLN